MINTQRPGFEELHKAFYDFFLESIRNDSSAWNKIRLQMLSQYFDDLALYKVINPIISRINSNPEDRRAIARAALWDALMAHHAGQQFVEHSVPYKVITQPQYVPAAVDPVPVMATSGFLQETQTAASGGVTEIVIAKAKPRGRPRKPSGE